MPSALLSNYKAATWGMVLGLAAIWCSDRWLGPKMQGPETLLGLGYLIMLGIAMHDLPEGMAIAMGGELKARTGMVIALAIAIHNIPEGMAIAAPLLMGRTAPPVYFAANSRHRPHHPPGSAIGSSAWLCCHKCCPGCWALPPG